MLSQDVCPFVRLRVCLSVCLSVTRRYSAQAAIHNVKLFLPSGRGRIPLFYSQQQTWSKIWSKTCVSVSQAGLNQVESQLRPCLKPGDFFTHVVWHDLEIRPLLRIMEDKDATVMYTALVVCSLGAATMLAV